jgi:DNA-directed RNA polymerase subunit RPC12/RpoP
MQFTSDVGMNFLITLLVVILITCACGRLCRRGDRGGYVSSDAGGIPGVSGGGAVRGCGMGFIVLGMAFFYSFGYYGWGIAAPFLVVGLCLTVAGSVTGGRGESQSYTQTRARPLAAPRTISDAPKDDLLFKASRFAEREGLLERRQDPYNPNLLIPIYRCPSCGQDTDFKDINIVDNAIECTHCGKRVDFKASQ